MPRDVDAYDRGCALRDAAVARAEGWVELCLEAALEDPHPFPRSEAALALTEAPDDLVVARLAEVIDAASQGSAVPAAVRWRAERLLIRRDPKAALKVVDEELRADDRARRYRAAEVLGRLGPGAIGSLRALCCSTDPGLRRRAVKGLSLLAEPGSTADVIALVDDVDRGIRLAALRALARLAEHPRLSSELGAAMKKALACSLDDDLEVRRAAIVAVSRLDTGSATPSPEQIGILLEAAEADDVVRAEAVELLGRCDDGEPALDKLLSSTDETSKVAAAFALARRAALAGDADSLAGLLTSSDGRLRLAAIRGLAAVPSGPTSRSALEAAVRDDDEGVRWLAARALEGRLDQRLAMVRQGRLPADAPSAQWPFGLPPPTASTQRRERLPLALATINLSYNLNLGVLIRSAEAAGAREVLVTGRDAFHRLAAMGADRWVELRCFETAAAMVAYARGAGYQLVAVQQGPGAERFDLADYPPRPCLMLGSEGHGLPPWLCAQADLVVEIPQRGEIDSLNVASAASIVLWACLSRRGWI